MNRFLRTLFLSLVVFLAAYIVGLAFYFHARGESILRTKTLWAVCVMIVFFIVAAWRFSLRAKFKVFLVLLGFLVVEALLQVLAWFGVLPAVNTKIRVPYARVYWAVEGRGNSIRNRFAWHYPGFDLKAAHRIAVIGDSQVEAVEVPRTRNQAFVLHTLLQRQSRDWSVLGLGSHGTSLAHAIDVLEYAVRHFRPEQAMVVVSVGSDISEASPALQTGPAGQYIYYDLGPDSNLVLNATCRGLHEAFRDALELPHRSLLINLPVTLNSHCMILQLGRSVRDRLGTRRTQALWASRAAQAQDAEAAEFYRIGFNPAPFLVEPDADARHAMAVLQAEVRRCAEICRTNGMSFRLVLIPPFPKTFYDSQRGREWTTRIGKYDFAKPEREIAAFARSNSIPVLSLGEYIRRRGLDVEEIRSLYLVNGTGHLSEKGHRFCAEAMLETFFPKQSL